ncbi:hypothetical protein SAMN04515656_10348 [Eubacterium aggregans]|uniref:Uncharacterized protein n=1 Tax=Eubacterium aggregans TaxID=81409 RepID=A0A1H3Y520_9FIRM|nr:hypothetical protein [Eubacterium aggregans]SEA06151.1 hypothetical protein SAMN04515656_10348 [Eubacterium aggregans]
MARDLIYNGVTLPAPTDYTYGYYDESSPDSGRTLDGTMFKKIVAQKNKIECAWKMVPDSQAAIILSTIKPNTYGTLRYPSPLTGGDATSTVYSGDVSAKKMAVINNVVYWEVKLNMIEQ